MTDKRLSDYALRQAEGRPLKVSDILNQEVTVTSYELRQGKQGQYAVMEVVNADGEILHVQTSGVLILDALENAKGAGALPARVTFKRDGQTYLLA